MNNFSFLSYVERLRESNYTLKKLFVKTFISQNKKNFRFRIFPKRKSGERMSFSVAVHD